MTLIYKILRAQEWADLEKHGETNGAPIDIADGYIHFSTIETLAETVSKHFAGQDGLKILAYDDTGMGNTLRYEVSRGNALFPHLYGMLRRDDAIWVKDLPLIDDHHIFPQGLL